MSRDLVPTMHDQDSGASDVDAICGLEWVLWAMEAARAHTEGAGSDGFRLDFANYYTDDLIAL